MATHAAIMKIVADLKVKGSRKGVSRQSIKGALASTESPPTTARINIALKKLVDSERLTQVKGSYKINLETAKKEAKAKAPKKKAVKKPVIKKKKVSKKKPAKKVTKKKPAAKKPATKKAAPAKKASAKKAPAATKTKKVKAAPAKKSSAKKTTKKVVAPK